MYFECYHSIHRWVVTVAVLYSYSSWNDDGGGFGSNDNSSIDVILCLNAMALWYWTGSFSPPPPHVPVCLPFFFSISGQVHAWFIELTSVAVRMHALYCSCHLFLFWHLFWAKGEASSCFCSQQLCAKWTQAPYAINFHVPKMTILELNKQPPSCGGYNTVLELVLLTAAE